MLNAIVVLLKLCLLLILGSVATMAVCWTFEAIPDLRKKLRNNRDPLK